MTGVQTCALPIFHEQESEEAECIAIVSRNEKVTPLSLPHEIDSIGVSAIWNGKANRLSSDHVSWPIIEEAAKASRVEKSSIIPDFQWPWSNPLWKQDSSDPKVARQILLQRRSAQAFDSHCRITQEKFIRFLSRLLPGPWSPWDTLYWPPFIHLAFFVHQVEGLSPGIYILMRDPQKREALQIATHSSFAWNHPKGISAEIPFYLMQSGDVRDLAASLSCQQDIAGDSFFSIGMIAEFAEPLQRYGAWFYRNLFWECGMIGQVLYLEAEAAGARGTGIGCYFDDPVHDMLGLKNHDYQCLYHFTIGIPLEDTRLLTKPGYERESIITKIG